MLKTIIKRNELGLLFRDGEFARLLSPGRHRLWSRILRPGSTRLEILDLQEVEFSHRDLEVLVKEPDLREQLLVLDLGETERAIVWKDGRLHTIAGPGLRAFYRDSGRIEVERHDIAERRFEHEKIEAILARPEASEHLTMIDVPQSEVALLIENGQLTEELGPGRHVFWTGFARLAYTRVDRRELLLEVSGQDILTADKVGLRLNLDLSYRVVDVRLAVTSSESYKQALYREAQRVVRQIVGQRKLDELMASKGALGQEIVAELEERAAMLGLEVKGAGVRDLILPGEMREILNQVITAQKRAEAEAIRRREETAAARSQANTAKLLADNPALARMRELELLREILEGTKLNLVLGEGDMLERLRSLTASESET